jgi:rubredoxin
LADVQIIKGKLESEGIKVYLKDDNTVGVEPFASNAIGGIKLQVHVADQEQAKAIYDEIRNYAVDDEDNLIKCPNCGAQKTEVHYLRNTMFYRLFPFFEPKKYRCTHCQFITKA